MPCTMSPCSTPPLLVEPGPCPTQGLQEAAHAPDDLDQLAHVNMVWDQKLGLIQDWQLLLTLVALDDHLRVEWAGDS